MTAVWPVSLPITQYAVLAIQPRDQRTIFQTEAGAPKTGSLSTDQIYIVIFDVIFQGDLSTFWTWWENDLANGSIDFTGLEDVATDAGARYKFSDQALPMFTMLSSGAPSLRRWRATFNLWKLP